jgi:hypothetical protein
VHVRNSPIVGISGCVLALAGESLACYIAAASGGTGKHLPVLIVCMNVVLRRSS